MIRNKYLYIFMLLMVSQLWVTNPSILVKGAGLSISNVQKDPSTVDPGDTVTISCTVSSYDLDELAVFLRWRVNGGSLNFDEMSSDVDTYTKSIGSFNGGDFVEYRVEAYGLYAESVTIIRYSPTSSSFFSFTVQGYPDINWISPANGADVGLGPDIPASFNFDWNYDNIDSAKLFLDSNEYIIYEGATKGTSVIISDLNGSVTGILRGYVEGVEVVSDTRLFNFIWLPTIEINLIYPNGGEYYDNSVIIAWSVTTDNQVTFTSELEYSINGTTWHEIASSTTETNYNWNTQTMAYNENYRVRVTIYGEYQGFTLEPAIDISEVVFTINPDTDGPIITGSENKSFVHNTTTGNHISWTISDPNPNKYSITRNGSYITTNLTWVSDQTVSVAIDNLTIGTYEYLITATDIWNQQSSDMIFVYILPPNITAIITSPSNEDICYDEIFIAWAIQTSEQTIFSSTIDYSTDGKDWHQIATNLINTSYIWNTHNFPYNQSYEIRVIVNGNYLGHDLLAGIDIIQFLTIDPDIEAPEITEPSDITYELGTQEIYLSWTISDRNPYNYSILRNNTYIIKNELVNENMTIIVPVECFTVGNYEYKVIVEDMWQQKSSDTVFLIVNDTVAPEISIISPIGNTTYFITSNTINISYNYSVSDLSEFNVSVHLNDTLISNDGSIDNLSVGTYVLFISAIDEYGNVADCNLTFSIRKEENNNDSIPSSFFDNLEEILPALLLIIFSGVIIGLLLLKTFGGNLNLSSLLAGSNSNSLFYNNEYQMPPLDPLDLEFLSEDDIL